jgi:radical SAM protein with 4Fe4S-binding SPASM domain
MDPKIWNKVLDELKLLSKPVTLLTHGAGEPLLYPELLELLIHAKKNPNITLGFMTNAMLMDENWANKIVDLKVDYLALSIDGVQPETNDYYRRNASLKTIEKNVEYLIERKRNNNSSSPVLSFNMVAYPEIVDQEMPFVEKWIKDAGSISIAKFRPVGSRTLFEPGHDIPFRPCPLLWNQMVIGTEGDVGLCCEDINLNVNLGSIKSNTVAEIFNNSKVLNHYREMHKKGEIAKLELCNNCHVWGGDITIKEESIKINSVDVLKKTTPAFINYSRI